MNKQQKAYLNLVKTLYPCIKNSIKNKDCSFFFLLKLLYETDKSRASKKVIYPLLTANLEKLETRFIRLLQNQSLRNLPTALAPFPKQGEAMAALFLNLGNLISDFPQGNRAINLEIAIQCQQIALTVLTSQSFPQEWANCKNDLGKSYLFRIWGEKGENLEAAIRSFQAALEVHTRETNPEVWAKIQVNLSAAYIQRIRGNRKENLTRALRCVSEALEVLDYQNFPSEWIEAQTNFSMVYIYSSQMGKEENLETGIQALLKIPEVADQERETEKWAENQRLLAFAYLARLREVEVENWTKSINYSSSALEIFTREAFPEKWAKSKITQGIALFRLNSILPRNEQNIDELIKVISEALQVYTRKAFPQEYVTAQSLLGITYKEDRQFSNAYNAFVAAIDTVESLRGEIVYGSGIEVDKQNLAEQWNQLYQEMMNVCLDLGYYDRAIEYAERSKTRNLVELIITRDRHTIFPAEVVAQLDRLRDEIAGGQYELQNATADDPTALAQHLQQLRQQRNELQDRYLPIGSGFQFEPFRSTMSDRTAIVEFYITSDKLLVFIVTQQTQQPIVLSPDLIDLNKLESWANSYLKAYRDKKSHWQRRLTTRLHLLAKIMHIDEIIEQVPTDCDKLILIPHRYLHLLPLHALPFAGNSSLFDKFPGGVSYAPSCQLLQLAQTRQRPEFTHLFAVQNPTNSGKPLSYAEVEVEAIKKYFDTTNVFKQEIATKEAIDNTSLTAVHCAHFSCHGYFNTTQPRKSALILANAQLSSTPAQPDAENYLSLKNDSILDLNKCLTLDNIFTLNLEKCRLVTLSACETGLIDWNNTSDEYIGLPSGFIYAGAFIVISSLWKVNDLSTAFLIIRFYQNLQKGLTVTLALNQAQLWLKNLTKGDMEKWIEEDRLQLKPTIAMDLQRRLYKLEDDAKPFESPLYWAAFCAIGGN